MLQTVYRESEVRRRFYPVSRAKFKEDIRAGKFPRADVKISERIEAWSESVLEAYQTKQREAALASQPMAA